MAVALTIFTIITGTASLLGFLYIFFGKSEKFKRISAAFFVLAFAWSVYVLVYPTSTVKNVAEKFVLYKAPAIEEKSANLLIQRGEITISGLEPLAVEFAYPFKDTPTVEVINVNGYNDEYIPRVQKITPHQVIFKSSADGGFQSSRQYNWVARGTPLEPLTQ
jgi:hypothetical protein